MGFQRILSEEIQSEFEELKKMELGTEEYKATVEGLTKLMDRAIEMEKIDIECQERVETRDIENDLKTKQMKDDQKDRLVRNSIAVAGIVIPSVITVWGTLKSLKFEEEGTITTMVGRGFINKLIPKK